MKKVSTTAVNATKTLSQYKLTIGLDLGGWRAKEPLGNSQPAAMPRRIKSTSSNKRKDKAQSRVPVTASMAWPTPALKNGTRGRLTGGSAA
jgi:hypothetical protein